MRESSLRIRSCDAARRSPKIRSGVKKSHNGEIVLTKTLRIPVSNFPVLEFAPGGEFSAHAITMAFPKRSTLGFGLSRNSRMRASK